MLPKAQITELKKNSVKNKKLSSVFNALSDPSRLQILKILLKREDVCVSDISKVLGVSVPAASRQLSILEQSGIIEKVRNGQMICFRVAKEDKVVKSVIGTLKKVDK